MLLLLRDSCGLIPRGNISHHNDPIAAFQTLTTLYKPNDKLKRDRLIQVFYSLKYTIGTNLSTFNAKFNTTVAKLAKKGAKIEPIDCCNNYLKALKKDCASWTNQMRQTLRTLRASYSTNPGAIPAVLPVETLIADALQNKRNY